MLSHSAQPAVQPHLHQAPHLHNNGAAIMQQGIAPVAQPQHQQAAGVNIFLKPYAFPSALGMASFFAGSWLLSTYLARWYGNGAITLPLLFPFIAVFSGLCQIWAGFRGFQARDNWATVWHVTWGSFYLALGIFQAVRQFGGYFNAVGVSSLSFLGGIDEWANIMVVVGAITFFCMLAALGRDIITFLTTLFAFAACVLLMAGWFAHDNEILSDNDGAYRTIKAGGYMLMASSFFALWRSGAYLLEEAFERIVLPVFHTRRHMAKPYVQIPVGEPGVKKGQ